MYLSSVVTSVILSSYTKLNLCCTEKIWNTNRYTTKCIPIDGTSSSRVPRSVGLCASGWVVKDDKLSRLPNGELAYSWRKAFVLIWYSMFTWFIFSQLYWLKILTREGLLVSDLLDPISFSQKCVCIISNTINALAMPPIPWFWYVSSRPWISAFTIVNIPLNTGLVTVCGMKMQKYIQKLKSLVRKIVKLLSSPCYSAIFWTIENKQLTTSSKCISSSLSFLSNVVFNLLTTKFL